LELIDIWKRVVEKRADARLAVIGDGPLEEEMKEKIKVLKLENSVELLGFRDGEEKYKIFRESKMILHPAIYDSGGMAAAEGMGWGLPAASFDLPALENYYPKGILKTKCFNFDEFAEKIIALLEDRELRNRTQKDAIDLVREKFDWRKNAERAYEKVFVMKNKS
jgi:glycosyltransferase involved in cell wall biosynthesis